MRALILVDVKHAPPVAELVVHHPPTSRADMVVVVMVLDTQTAVERFSNGSSPPRAYAQALARRLEPPPGGSAKIVTEVVLVPEMPSAVPRALLRLLDIAGTRAGAGRLERVWLVGSDPEMQELVGGELHRAWRRRSLDLECVRWDLIWPRVRQANHPSSLNHDDVPHSRWPDDPTVMIEDLSLAWGVRNHPMPKACALGELAKMVEDDPALLTQLSLTTPKPAKIVTRGIDRMDKWLNGRAQTIVQCSPEDGVEYSQPVKWKPAVNNAKLTPSAAGPGAARLKWKDVSGDRERLTVRTTLPPRIACALGAANSSDLGLARHLDDQMMLAPSAGTIFSDDPLQVTLTCTDGLKLRCATDARTAFNGALWWCLGNGRAQSEVEIDAPGLLPQREPIGEIAAFPKIFNSGLHFGIAMVTRLAATDRVRIPFAIQPNTIGLGISVISGLRCAVLALGGYLRKETIATGTPIDQLTNAGLRGLRRFMTVHAVETLRSVPIIVIDPTNAVVSGSAQS